MPGACDDVKARLRARIAAIEAAGASCSLDEAAGISPPGAAPQAAPGGPAGRRGGGASVAAGAPGAPAPASEDGFGEAGEAERAFRKIERLASAREQASAALRARLAREGFAPDAAEAAVARALACGLVDDRRYAEVLVRSRLAQGRGAQGIEAELAGLGIDAASVPGWPDEFTVDHDSEVERALGVLERKPPRAKNKREAAFRRLAQKGFGSSVASTAARLWTESNPD